MNFILEHYGENWILSGCFLFDFHNRFEYKHLHLLKSLFASFVLLIPGIVPFLILTNAYLPDT